MSGFCESRRMAFFDVTIILKFPFGAIRYRSWRPTFFILRPLMLFLSTLPVFVFLRAGLYGQASRHPRYRTSRTRHER